jgi:hypothetical protein
MRMAGTSTTQLPAETDLFDLAGRVSYRRESRVASAAERARSWAEQIAEMKISSEIQRGWIRGQVPSVVRK